MRIKSNKYQINQNWSYTRENKETNKRVCFILYASSLKIFFYYYIYFLAANRMLNHPNFHRFWVCDITGQQKSSSSRCWFWFNTLKWYTGTLSFLPFHSCDQYQRFSAVQTSRSAGLWDSGGKRHTFLHLLKCLANWRTHILWLTHSRAEIIKYL